MIEHLEWLIWFVVLLPLLGFAVNISIGQRLPKIFISVFSCLTIFVPFLISVLAFFRVSDSGAFSSILFEWIKVAGVNGERLSINIPLLLYVDHLSVVMMLVVSGVSFIIHVYSIGYMWEDKRYARYFSFLNLFVGFMLLLVMAKNLLLMFVGWEGVGLCSYLLIGFWFEETKKAVAGMKAFIVNRIGDFAFTVGVILLFVSVGSISGVWTLDIQELSQNVGHLAPGVITLISILLFCGACGKSAQAPLYVWLPDAMEGPTPVSALIHAATMVTAGVYMVARMNFLYALSPVALTVVATIGAFTALFAATIGTCQTDFKRILAYSTISQIGYMFLGVGSGAFAAGIFHLMTHAFFKACLFLCSGSVIHATHQYDIRAMGGLRKFMPITYITFLISTLAIAGIPPFSGFFSKDEILFYAFTSEKLIVPWWGKMLWCVGIIGAGFTAFYMFRLLYVSFAGGYRGAVLQAHPDGGGVKGHKPHESPPIMTIPLIILAFFAIIAGFVGVPKGIVYVVGIKDYEPPFEKFLHPTFEKHTHHNPAKAAVNTHKEVHKPTFTIEFVLMGISIAIAIIGILIATHMYIWKPQAPEKLSQKFKKVYHIVYNKYFVDEIYQGVIVEPILRFDTALARHFDYGVIDATVDGTGYVTGVSSQHTGNFDNLIIDGAVNRTAEAARSGGEQLRKIHTGNIKEYILATLVGALVLISAFCIFLLRDEIANFIQRIF
jgi:NADH-quinone oxidoreductase subunit L